MASTTVRDLVTSMRTAALSSTLAMRVLAQDEWWVPKAAWQAFGDASVITYAYLDAMTDKPAVAHMVVVPDWTVSGLVRVSDMDDSWRANALRLVERNAPAMCFGMSYSFLLTEYFSDSARPGDHAQDAIDREGELWLERAQDAALCAAWLSSQPLIRALTSQATQ